MLSRALTCARQHTRGGGGTALCQLCAAPAESPVGADGRALPPGLRLHCDLSTGSVDGTAAPAAPPAQQAQGWPVAVTPQLPSPGTRARHSPVALGWA